MSVLSFVQILRSYFLFTTVGFTFIRFCDKAHGISTSCQVYPSEYAYEDDSVNRAESASANCRRYPEGDVQGGVYPEHYIHCDGIQLKLTDSNLGQRQYQSTNYYVWSSRSGDQLLFIFPTRVSLTTITLHYYSDSVRGLPRLRFCAVPDDFHVWNVPVLSYSCVDVASVPPGGEPAGHRNISINIDFITKKLLMYWFSSSRSFHFAVSEVEFFTCNTLTFTTTEVIDATTQWTLIPTVSTTTTTGSTEDGYYGIQSSSSSNKSSEIIAWVLVVILLVLLIVSLVIHVMQAVWAHRRNCNRNQNTSPEGTVGMACSNPCYEASVVNLYEGKEAVRVYENFKPQ